MSESPKSSFRTLEAAPIVATPSQGNLQFVTVKSNALAGRGDITIYSPSPSIVSDPLPVIILLHGVYGSHWSWAMQGQAHVTLQSMIDDGTIPPMILAMPSDGLWGDGSGYCNHSEKKFEQWIVDDVPKAVSEVTGNALDAPHFISGLSMGGYGAMRLGAKHAGRFSAFTGHSSITNLAQMSEFVEEDLESYITDNNSEQSVLETILKNRSTLPPFRFDCGKDDPLIEHNRTLAKELKNQGIDFDYEEPPGEHTWPYWTEHVSKTFLFFAGICQ
jgi:enterochelin esterase-like enzyme